MTASGGKIAALVLAGGKPMGNDWPADVRATATYRAQLPIRESGETMQSVVVSAVRDGLLRAMGDDGSRVLIATNDTTAASNGATQITGGVTLIETIMNGVAALRDDETCLLIATADTPFLTVAAVADVLRQSLAANADFVYPIVPVALCRERYPTLPRTALKTADGVFTGGNLTLVNPRVLRERQSLIESAYSKRKSVAAIAALLGAPTLLRLALSPLVPQLLPVSYLESAISKALGGATARAVVSQFPEIATDVDKPDDYRAVRALIALAESGQTPV